MPSKETIQLIADAYHSIRATMPGFRERESQRRMIWEVAKALDGEHDHQILAVEAPTGTGKSLGYLLGGIPVAREREVALVIATATITLQEQILNQDLPKLAEYAGLEVKACVAKGRGRYVCPRNLKALLDESEHNDEGRQQALAPEVLGSAAWSRPPREGEIDNLNAMLDALKEGEWQGDLDEWPNPPASPDLYNMITSTPHSCTGRRCADFFSCPVYQARERMREAEVVIANHDLLLADLQLGDEGGGVVMPNPAESLYVIDEGHRFASKAVRRFAVSAKVQAAREWINDGLRTVQEIRGLLSSEPQEQQLSDSVGELLREVHEVLQDVDEFLQHNYTADEDEDLWRFRAGRAPEEVVAIAQRVAKPAQRLQADLDKLAEKLDAAMSSERVNVSELEKHLPRLGFLRERADNLATTWGLMSTADEDDKPPVARWIERHEGKTGQGDHLISAAPVSVAGDLAVRFWQRCLGAVITSATLTALGKFDRLRRDLGLEADERVAVGRLPSPFDYSSSLLSVPAMRTDPKDGREHTNEVIEQLKELLRSDEAALVLFTSRSRMEHVAESLPKRLRALIQCQGERSREAMLRHHRQAIDAGEGSILFGLASMAEGVDLPGAYCDHVIIERIPFSVPSEPVEATRREWLEDRGERPFYSVSLPDASLRLVQACGRLVRSETDQGRITILDRRIVSKSYGKALINSLPPFTRDVQ
ncbi:ATP-dependent DNA helicase DinG [Halorhodospira halochloris]|uniref:ATP-dependent DNA helicase DinG n=1 Tax=Halorhodospira halochloris TaxID=1052 RepID=UPI001EE80ADF|nr:ATP-dependent DNA helicase DinG [Halorhodospira halochloris]MCG5548455.1 ATP-dependent DNA helicase DinG [Halorhodospira halochloris]